MLLWATSTRAHFSVGGPVTDSERSGEEQTNLKSMNTNGTVKQEKVGGSMIKVVLCTLNINYFNMISFSTNVILYS